LLLGLTSQNAPGHAQRLAKLRAMKEAGVATLDALDLPTDLPQHEAMRPPPIELVELLQSGFGELPLISWPADVIALAGGMKKLEEKRSEHESICLDSGHTPGESAVEANRATERAIPEAIVARLPLFAALLRDLAAAAIGTLVQPREGRRQDYTTLFVMRDMAAAHKALFGFRPILRNTEKDRDTPSVRWVSEVLRKTVLHMRRQTKTPRPPKSGDQSADRPDSPESQAFSRMAVLGLDTISDWLAEARKQEKGADA